MHLRGHGGALVVDQTATIDRVLAAKETFLAKMSEIPELGQALGYIPNSVDSTALVMRYIDEETMREATGGLSMVAQIYLVELYCYGYDRQEMQERFERIVLQKRQILRSEPLLERTVKKRYEVTRLGDPQVVLLNGNPVVRQQWRYSYEMQVSR